MLEEKEILEYSDEYDREELYSKSVRAGKRTYFFDVKITRNDDLYITISESRKKVEKDGSFTFEKHKLFLYKEDYQKFTEGLFDVLNFVKEKAPLYTDHSNLEIPLLNKPELNLKKKKY
jgi:hypothetical protein